MRDSLAKAEERAAYIILVAPALFFYLFVMAFPTIFSVVISLSNFRGGKILSKGSMSFAGFKAYTEIFKDPYFFMALKNNIYIVLISVFGQIPLGFCLAYILSRGGVHCYCLIYFILSFSHIYLFQLNSIGSSSVISSILNPFPIYSTDGKGLS